MYEKGGELSNSGALRKLPQEASGRQAPPFFPINGGGGLFQKYS